MAQQFTEARSYRATYHPKDQHGHPVASDAGVLPFIQLKAANAEDAHRLANATTGCVIANVERVEEADEVAA